MAIDDIYTNGIASGWKVLDASTFKSDQQLEADVVIVGTGAGGGTAAEILAQAGLKVLMVEEGPLKTAADFKDMDESRAYRDLYQQGAGRASSDGSIPIMQGRAVGGTTVVNYTSSFRTPSRTLQHWADVHEVKGHGVKEMQPWFEKMEQRLGIQPWGMAPNANNGTFKQGCEKLGWEWHVIPRNVRGCWNTGYCGFGCPTNAKQSMLVSTIPSALQSGATLVHHLSVRRVEFTGGKVTGLTAAALDGACIKPTGINVTLRARHYVLAGGALNTPALLLRSKAPDPHDQLGQRSFIHAVNLSMAEMPERIDPFYGAPQSIASDQFLWHGEDATGPLGYKLESGPLATGFTAAIYADHGDRLRQAMAGLPHTQVMAALMRDGFSEHSSGGRVRIDAQGEPLLDYVFGEYDFDGFRRAYLSMAELQFAAGAKVVKSMHLDAPSYTSWSQAKAGIPELRYTQARVGAATFHLMGGCGMSENPKRGVVNSAGHHHQIENLSVFDGSVFPTSIGANPQLSIYGLIAQNATALAQALKA